MRYALMNLPNRRHASVVAVAVAIAMWSGRSSPAAVAPDEVLNWNTVATSVAPATGINGVLQSRIYAMTQLAVHDALNAIAHHYEPYVFTQRMLIPLASV
jgi:hypothetical protein